MARQKAALAINATVNTTNQFTTEHTALHGAVISSQTAGTATFYNGTTNADPVLASVEVGATSTVVLSLPPQGVEAADGVFCETDVSMNVTIYTEND